MLGAVIAVVCLAGVGAMALNVSELTGYGSENSNGDVPTLEYTDASGVPQAPTFVGCGLDGDTDEAAAGTSSLMLDKGVTNDSAFDFSLSNVWNNEACVFSFYVTNPSSTDMTLTQNYAYDNTGAQVAGANDSVCLANPLPSSCGGSDDLGIDVPANSTTQELWLTMNVQDGGGSYSIQINASPAGS